MSGYGQFPPSSPAVNTIDFGTLSPNSSFHDRNGFDGPHKNELKSTKEQTGDETESDDTMNANGARDNSFILPTPHPSSALHNSSPVKKERMSLTLGAGERIAHDQHLNTLSSPIKNQFPVSNEVDDKQPSMTKDQQNDIGENFQAKNCSTPVKSVSTSSVLSSISSSNNEHTQIKQLHYPLVHIPIKYSLSVFKETGQMNPVEVKCGRKSANNDVSLPRDKWISRKHLIISYIPQSVARAQANVSAIHGTKSTVKLPNMSVKCLGMNGCIVVYPRQMFEYELVQRGENVFELAHISNITNTDDIATKQLIKKNDLTSFVIYQDETVSMPFVKGMVLDFGKFEALIAPKNISKHKVQKKQVLEIPRLGSTQKDSIKETLTDITNTENNKPQVASATPTSTAQTESKPPLKMNHSDSKPSITVKKRKLPQDSPTREDSKESFLECKEAIEKSLENKNIDVPDMIRVLINHLAYASVQQVPLTSLFHVNTTISKLTKKELRYLLITRCECVGVIYRTGKDAAGKPLDEEYYYEFDKDTDQDRKAIVMSLKGGRANLRSCRKTHKQYFWKKPKK
ncbi:hypothetical protein ACO0QE_002246 [Hanseniaspora vineae]